MSARRWPNNYAQYWWITFTSYSMQLGFQTLALEHQNRFTRNISAFRNGVVFVIFVWYRHRHRACARVMYFVFYVLLRPSSFPFKFRSCYIYRLYLRVRWQTLSHSHKQLKLHLHISKNRNTTKNKCNKKGRAPETKSFVYVCWFLFQLFWMKLCRKKAIAPHD